MKTKRAWHIQYEHPSYSISKYAVVFAVDAATAIVKFAKKAKRSERSVISVQLITSGLQIA